MALTNEQIEAYETGAPDIDCMIGFNYVARGALIEKKITENEYYEIEDTLKSVNDTVESLSPEAKSILKDILSGI